jgi:tRNA-specific 2-thiouridylase
MSMTAVAMSGGLDSSVVAWMLAQGDEEVVGLSMLLWDRGEEVVHGRCCGALDLGDARRVAEQCGIPHYTLRMEEEFRSSVVDPFVDGYLAGTTPVPCTSCNTWIKFGLFLERARQLGAQRIATGHYARIVKVGDEFELHAARHLDKDQSYYLFELTQEQLAASSFPLGEKTKEEVREMARQVELRVAEKGESMELCFVTGSVREFVEQEAAARPEIGEIAASGAKVRDSEGAVLGEGEPYYRYTVGQRRGLGLASPERLYVLGVDAGANEVVVGGREELLAEGLVGSSMHWIGTPPEGVVEATVKIRARHPGVGCRIRVEADRTLIEFDQPQHGVAPGQAAVVYQDSRVLGGCWIESALKDAGDRPAAVPAPQQTRP